MYRDRNLTLCEAEEMIGSSTSVYGSYSVDLGATTDVGRGAPLNLVICVTTAYASGTSTGTATFILVDEADATIDSGSVPIVSTGPLIVTRLTAGKVIVVPIPANLITQQFLGLKVTLATEEVTAGSIDAFITLDGQTN